VSRWRQDPEGAADELMRRSLDAIAPEGRVLVANATETLPLLLAERGVAPAIWNQRFDGRRAAAPWPPPGPFDTVLLRLAKAKEEQEMAAHACLGALDPGGRLILYGGNDEGIRSGAALLEGLCGEAPTLSARGHGRVVAASRPADVTRLRSALAGWRRTSRIAVAGRERDWVTYPGVFAGDRMDEGTRLLIGALPSFAAGMRVLDYGCGSGLIAGALLGREPGVRVDMLDADTVALEAARENVPEARAILGVALFDTDKAVYDAIVSNPPLHAGIAESHSQLERLIGDAPRHLRAGGLLEIVVQRRIPLESLLARHFASVQTVAEDGRFRVWAARRK
jgi:16S rRNA (guanine1207-N2)-methyltransferase